LKSIGRDRPGYGNMTNCGNIRGPARTPSGFPIDNV
jgi:hypothetical protein